MFKKIFKQIKSILNSLCHFRIKFNLKHLFIVALGGLLIIAIIIIRNFLYSWKIGEPGDEALIKIKSGSSVLQIASQLQSSGIIVDQKGFIVCVKLMRTGKELQAGTYVFSGKQSNLSVIHTLQKGKVQQVKLAFPEGITSRRAAELVEERLGIDSQEFLFFVNYQPFIDSLGVLNHSLEGYLFPETYYFPIEADAKIVIETMVQRFQAVFDDSLRERCIESGFTLHEILTVASIVEGEAVLSAERPIIASLYYNRLKIGRALEACPTIQYIIPNGPRRLKKEDLEIQSQYNTYIHRGLPPGPVNNPGKASIMAALYPDTTKFLYLVANGDGSHTFSINYQDHIQAKRSFDRVRRQVRRQGYR